MGPRNLQHDDGKGGTRLMFGTDQRRYAPMLEAQAPQRRMRGIFGKPVSGLPAAINGGDDGTLANKGMPMIESAKGTAMREGTNSALPGNGMSAVSPLAMMRNQDPSRQYAEGKAAAESLRAESTTGASPNGPLGGSMRQPFDYEAAKKILAGEKPEIKDWQKVLAVVGDALVQHSGGQPMAMQNIIARQDDYSKRQFEAAQQILNWQYGDYEAQRDADLKAANPFTIGRDRVGYDPATGQARVLYDGPEDFELYASELGLEEGTPEYFQAVEDFVLRSSGPSADTREVRQ